MKYSLVVHKEGLNTIEINGFATLSQHDNLNEHALEDIIKFTNEFTCEEDLMETLLLCGLIPKNYSNGTFGISYQKGKDTPPKILQYGISYKEDAKFFNTEYLKYYFTQKLNNKNFMEDFLHKYYGYLKNKQVFSELLNFIKHAYESRIAGKYLSSEELEYNVECMEKFVTYYTRKKVKDGTYKPAMSGLRDLAMFAINFERTYNRCEKNNRFKDESYRIYLEMQFEHYEFLLLRSDNTQEEIDAYETELERLQQELILVSEKDYSRGRRLEEDEFTED